MFARRSARMSCAGKSSMRRVSRPDAGREIGIQIAVAESIVRPTCRRSRDGEVEDSRCDREAARQTIEAQGEVVGSCAGRTAASGRVAQTWQQNRPANDCHTRSGAFEALRQNDMSDLSRWARPDDRKRRRDWASCDVEHDEAAHRRLASGRRRRVDRESVAAEGASRKTTTSCAGSTAWRSPNRHAGPMTRFHRRSLLAARRQIRLRLRKA